MSNAYTICNLCGECVFINSGHLCQEKPRVSGPGEMERPTYRAKPVGDFKLRKDALEGQKCIGCNGELLKDTFEDYGLGLFLHKECLLSTEQAKGVGNVQLQNPPDYPYNLTKNDPVHSPSHYTFSKYQVQDVLDVWNLDHYYRVIIQYLARAGRKVPLGKTPLEAEIEDCEKALWYLSRKINILKNQGHHGNKVSSPRA